MFELTNQPIDPAALEAKFRDGACGALVVFEGRVRNLNDGKPVERLEYEVFGSLAGKEGARILEEAMRNFAIARALCVHRTGVLEIGGIAVWVGVEAGHRGAAFDACRFVIDEVKARVPIWKKEHYADGRSEWVETVGPGRGN
ncbi:MAG TPA: molybdenum cofactor biosynthesis protein MoaE [Opitutaceae bacterium]|nr:molybdenum cofactor biosynthesis protein MoaE [Opitutaceae bacterium]